MRELITNLQEALEALSQETPQEISQLVLQLTQRVDAFESAKGATTHFRMVRGVGEEPGVDETKGVANIAMPKHTARRQDETNDLPFNLSAELPFDLPDDEEYGTSSGGRKTEPMDTTLHPLDPYGKTPPEES